MPSSKNKRNKNKNKNKQTSSHNNSIMQSNVNEQQQQKSQQKNEQDLQFVKQQPVIGAVAHNPDPIEQSITIDTFDSNNNTATSTIHINTLLNQQQKQQQTQTMIVIDRMENNQGEKIQQEKIQVQAQQQVQKIVQEQQQKGKIVLKQVDEEDGDLKIGCQEQQSDGVISRVDDNAAQQQKNHPTGIQPLKPSMIGTDSPQTLLSQQQLPNNNQPITQFRLQSQQVEIATAQNQKCNQQIIHDNINEASYNINEVSQTNDGAVVEGGSQQQYHPEQSILQSTKQQIIIKNSQKFSSPQQTDYQQIQPNSSSEINTTLQQYQQRQQQNQQQRQKQKQIFKKPSQQQYQEMIQTQVVNVDRQLEKKMQRQIGKQGRQEQQYRQNQQYNCQTKSDKNQTSIQQGVKLKHYVQSKISIDVEGCVVEGQSLQQQNQKQLQNQKQQQPFSQNQLQQQQTRTPKITQQTPNYIQQPLPHDQQQHPIIIQTIEISKISPNPTNSAIQSLQTQQLYQSSHLLSPSQQQQICNNNDIDNSNNNKIVQQDNIGCEGKKDNNDIDEGSNLQSINRLLKNESLIDQLREDKFNNQYENNNLEYQPQQNGQTNHLQQESSINLNRSKNSKQLQNSIQQNQQQQSISPIIPTSTHTVQPSHPNNNTGLEPNQPQNRQHSQNLQQQSTQRQKQLIITVDIVDGQKTLQKKEQEQKQEKLSEQIEKNDKQQVCGRDCSGNGYGDQKRLVQENETVAISEESRIGIVQGTDTKDDLSNNLIDNLQKPILQQSSQNANINVAQHIEQHSQQEQHKQYQKPFPNDEESYLTRQQREEPVCLSPQKNYPTLSQPSSTSQIRQFFNKQAKYVQQQEQQSQKEEQQEQASDIEEGECQRHFQVEDNKCDYNNNNNYANKVCQNTTELPNPPNSPTILQHQSNHPLYQLQSQQTLHPIHYLHGSGHNPYHHPQNQHYNSQQTGSDNSKHNIQQQSLILELMKISEHPIHHLNGGRRDHKDNVENEVRELNFQISDVVCVPNEKDYYKHKNDESKEPQSLLNNLQQTTSQHIITQQLIPNYNQKQHAIPSNINIVNFTTSNIINPNDHPPKIINQSLVQQSNHSIHQSIQLQNGHHINDSFFENNIDIDNVNIKDNIIGLGRRDQQMLVDGGQLVLLNNGIGQLCQRGQQKRDDKNMEIKQREYEQKVEIKENTIQKNEYMNFSKRKPSDKYRDFMMDDSATKKVEQTRQSFQFVTMEFDVNKDFKGNQNQKVEQQQKSLIEKQRQSNTLQQINRVENQVNYLQSPTNPVPTQNPILNTIQIHQNKQSSYNPSLPVATSSQISITRLTPSATIKPTYLSSSSLSSYSSSSEFKSKFQPKIMSLEQFRKKHLVTTTTQTAKISSPTVQMPQLKDSNVQIQQITSTHPLVISTQTSNITPAVVCLQQPKQIVSSPQQSVMTKTINDDKKIIQQPSKQLIKNENFVLQQPFQDNVQINRKNQQQPQVGKLIGNEVEFREHQQKQQASHIEINKIQLNNISNDQSHPAINTQQQILTINRPPPQSLLIHIPSNQSSSPSHQVSYINNKPSIIPISAITGPPTTNNLTPIFTNNNHKQISQFGLFAAKDTININDNDMIKNNGNFNYGFEGSYKENKYPQVPLFSYPVQSVLPPKEAFYNNTFTTYSYGGQNSLGGINQKWQSASYELKRQPASIFVPVISNDNIGQAPLQQLSPSPKRKIKLTSPHHSIQLMNSGGSGKNTKLKKDIIINVSRKNNSNNININTKKSQQNQLQSVVDYVDCYNNDRKNAVHLTTQNLKQQQQNNKWNNIQQIQRITSYSQQKPLNGGRNVSKGKKQKICLTLRKDYLLMKGHNDKKHITEHNQNDQLSEYKKNINENRKYHSFFNQTKQYPLLPNQEKLSIQQKMSTEKFQTSKNHPLTKIKQVKLNRVSNQSNNRIITPNNNNNQANQATSNYQRPYTNYQNQTSHTDRIHDRQHHIYDQRLFNYRGYKNNNYGGLQSNQFSYMRNQQYSNNGNIRGPEQYVEKKFQPISRFEQYKQSPINNSKNARQNQHYAQRNIEQYKNKMKNIIKRKQANSIPIKVLPKQITINNTTKQRIQEKLQQEPQDFWKDIKRLVGDKLRRITTQTKYPQTNTQNDDNNDFSDVQNQDNHLVGGKSAMIN